MGVFVRRRGGRRPDFSASGGLLRTTCVAYGVVLCRVTRSPPQAQTRACPLPSSPQQSSVSLHIEHAVSAFQSGIRRRRLRPTPNSGDGMWVSTELGSEVDGIRQSSKWIRWWRSTNSVVWNVRYLRAATSADRERCDGVYDSCAHGERPHEPTVEVERVLEPSGRYPRSRTQSNQQVTFTPPYHFIVSTT